MAKNKKKRSKKVRSDYEVGYGKPPKQYQWEKGCKSPNPKGRPKKIRTLKEALQVSFNKEITTKNENGEIKRITCLEALASKTIADAISKDGPTRRLLYRQDLMNLISQEPEIEYSPEEQKIIDIENKYGQLLHNWAEMKPEIRESASRIIFNVLIDYMNDKSMEGENDG